MGPQIQTKVSGGFGMLMDRTIAAEVEKHFETKVNPETIKERARRMYTGTNVPPQKKPVKSNSKPEIKQIKRAKDGTLRGGARSGAGRKPKKRTIQTDLTPEKNPEDIARNIVSDHFKKDFITMAHAGPFPCLFNHGAISPPLTAKGQDTG